MRFSYLKKEESRIEIQKSSSLKQKSATGFAIVDCLKFVIWNLLFTI